MSRIPAWRDYLSVCADVIQVTTFFGVTLAGLVAAFVMLIGWLTDVSWFWIAVGTPIAVLGTLLFSAKLRRPQNQAAVSVEGASSPELIKALADLKKQERLQDKQNLRREELKAQTMSATENQAIQYTVINVYDHRQITVLTNLRDKQSQGFNSKLTFETVESAYLKIAPGKMELMNSSNVSSVSDEGSGRLTINFVTPLDPQKLGFTSTVPSTSCVSVTSTSARIAFDEKQSVVEFRFITNPSSGSTSRSS